MAPSGLNHPHSRVGKVLDAFPQNVRRRDKVCVVSGHSGIKARKASLKYGTLKFLANFCGDSRVVEETKGITMPNRPVFALLVTTLLGFPVALLAQEVVQTQKFNYPLAGGGKFTIDDINGTIAIRCWERNEVEIAATEHADSQADLDAIRIDIKQRTGSVEVHTVYSSPGPHNGGVSYQVVVPKDLGNLEANTANGSISA